MSNTDSNADKSSIPDSARAVIFAKLPRAGQVKTRMIGALTAEQAAQLHQICMKATYRAAVKTLGARRVTVATSPDGTDAQFGQILGVMALTTQQGDGDLGQRLSRVSKQAFDNDDAPVLLLGCDCPLVSREVIKTAILTLHDCDVVIGPATDGGYYLLGTNEFHAGLFRDIDWSTEHVAEQTRQRIASAGLTLQELPQLSDLDVHDDLLRLHGDWPTDRSDLAELRTFLDLVLSTERSGD